jgi:type IV pilus assembly protein PilW
MMRLEPHANQTVMVRKLMFMSRKQAGVTLLELLISMSLGLLLLVGIGTIYVGSNQTYRVQEQNARIQESGRYALDVIGRSLRHAGYTTCISTSFPVQTCFTGTPITGTANTVTVQYDGVVGERDCEGNNVAAAMVVQDAIQLNGTDLQCDGNVDAAVDPQPLVSNVEALQFLYGIDTTGDQSADQYVAAPGNWNQVVSVRTCVLIRSEDQGISVGSQSYLNCNGALNGTASFTTAAAGDSRLRRTFVATFSLRNRTQ